MIAHNIEVYINIHKNLIIGFALRFLQCPLLSHSKENIKKIIHLLNINKEITCKQNNQPIYKHTYSLDTIFAN